MTKRVLAKDKKTLADSRSNGQSGKHKQFSQTAHDRHDAVSVNAVIRHLDEVGVWAKGNDDRFGPDLVIWEGFRPVRYIEVEQRSGWQTGPFPWDPVNVLERKLHLFNLGLRCDLWIISMDLKFALIIPDSALSKGRMEEFHNSQIATGENFLRVPLAECIHEELQDGNGRDVPGSEAT